MNESEIKSIVRNTVLEFLNNMPTSKKLPVNFKKSKSEPVKFDVRLKQSKSNPISPAKEEEYLPDEDREKIETIVTEVCRKSGVLAFTYRTNIEEGQTAFGARIDHTGKGDWVLAKEEILYKLPIKYNNILHEFVRNLRKKLMESKE